MSWLDAPSHGDADHPSRRGCGSTRSPRSCWSSWSLPTLIVVPMSLLGVAVPRVPAAPVVAALVRGLLRLAIEWLQATATSFKAGDADDAARDAARHAGGLRPASSRARAGPQLVYATLLLTPIIVPVILVAIGIFYALRPARSSSTR